MTLYNEKNQVVDKVDLHVITSKEKLHEIMREKGFVLKKDTSGAPVIGTSREDMKTSEERMLEDTFDLLQIPTSTSLFVRFGFMTAIVIVTVRFCSHYMSRFRRSNRME
jgi:hypothetical protein